MRRPMGRCGMMMAILVSGLTSLSATTWYVAPDGNDDGNDGKSWSAPFATIQKAMDNVENKDTIIISNGTYAISEELNTAKTVLTIKSLTLDPKDVVIDCGRRCRGIRVSGWGAFVCGLTIENAFSTDLGGGIRLGSRSCVSNCVVRGCTSCVTDKDALGGGIYAGAETVIADSLIENCTASNVLKNLKTWSDPKYARGGGIYLTGRVIGCEIRNCAVYGPFNGLRGVCSGGGIYAKVTENTDQTINAAEIINCTVCSNRAVSITKSAQGDGGGISLECVPGYANGQSVSNCHVFANQASYAGGGLCVDGPGVVSDSTIESNKVDNTLFSAGTAYDWGGGGGIATWQGGTVVERCKVSDNGVMINTTATNSRKTGGGGVLMAAPQSVVRNCVITGNSAPFGAAVRLGDLAETLQTGFAVSNCLIAANEGGGGIVASSWTDGNLIDSCLIVSNSVTHGSVFNWYRGENGVSFAAGTVIRNTLYRGNENTSASQSPTTGAGYGLGEMGTTNAAPLRIEQCSFINETIEFTLGCLFGQRSAFSKHNATNLTFVGCLLYGDADHPRCKFGNTAYNDGAHISCCYAANAPTDDPTLGNFDKATSPGFANEAGGDFRLAKDSVLVDRGGDAQPWMGRSRRKGVTDMGDGTMTLAKCADWGVRPTVNDAQPRLSGDGPDIGCFEVYWPRGLILMFR